MHSSSIAHIILMLALVISMALAAVIPRDAEPEELVSRTVSISGTHNGEGKALTSGPLTVFVS